MRCIWTTENDHMAEWEASWLKCILGDQWNQLEHIHDPGLKLSPVANSVLVINMKTLERKRTVAQYLKRYAEAQCAFGLIHLSDEYYDNDYSIYQHPECAWVWRNYWHPAFMQMHKVRCFALGYKPEFAQTTDCTLNRNTKWCFAGCTKYRHPDRIVALNTFLNVAGGRYIIEEGNSFNDRKTGLDTDNYRTMLQTSVFALCPPGNINMDSFRICEALEAGAIPVVTRKTPQQDYQPSYWSHVFNTNESDLPFIIKDSWESCRKAVEHVCGQPRLVHDMQNNCSTFWTKYKKDLCERIGNDIKALDSKNLR